jgi:U3 small nucleolar RNA-associated protein 11
LAKKITKLKAGLHMISPQATNKHTIFLEDKIEVENFSGAISTLRHLTVAAAEYFQTLPEVLNRSFNRPHIEALKNGTLIVNARPPPPTRVEKEKKKLYDELLARMQR